MYHNIIKSVTQTHNKFFISSLLIFTFLAAINLSNFSSNILNPSGTYPQILSVCLVLIAQKVFIVSFHNLINNIEGNKWFVFLLNLVLVSLQGWLLQTALQFLTLDSYPQNWFGIVAISTGLFIIQLLFGGVRKQLNLALPTAIIYAICFALLYQKIFNAELRFLQLIAMLSLVLEGWALSWNIRWFLKNSTHKQ